MCRLQKWGLLFLLSVYWSTLELKAQHNILSRIHNFNQTWKVKHNRCNIVQSLECKAGKGQSQENRPNVTKIMSLMRCSVETHGQFVHCVLIPLHINLFKRIVLKFKGCNSRRRSCCGRWWDRYCRFWDTPSLSISSPTPQKEKKLIKIQVGVYWTKMGFLKCDECRVDLFRSASIDLILCLLCMIYYQELKVTLFWNIVFYTLTTVRCEISSPLVELIITFIRLLKHCKGCEKNLSLALSAAGAINQKQIREIKLPQIILLWCSTCLFKKRKKYVFLQVLWGTVVTADKIKMFTSCRCLLCCQGRRGESQLSWCEGGSNPGQVANSVQRTVIHTHICGHLLASSRRARLCSRGEARGPGENREPRESPAWRIHSATQSVS